jgi:hypothetical protein
MIPYDKFHLYINAYKLLYINIDNIQLIEKDIEYILPTFIEMYNIKLVDQLGITQRISVHNEISDI